MSLIGKGRVFSETRVDRHCGARTLWHVVVFVDEFDGKEREVGRFVDESQALAVRARWAKETCVTTLAPIKFTYANKIAKETSSGPRGHRKVGNAFRATRVAMHSTSIDRRDIPKPAMKTETKTADQRKETGSP